jgi:hypothetical protein
MELSKAELIDFAVWVSEELESKVSTVDAESMANEWLGMVR